jgi:cytochrome P450
LTPHVAISTGTLSLYHLLDPEVLADPYPLYQRMRTEDPVLWDPYLHAWVVTRYRDVVDVFQRFSARRTPTPERLAALGMERLTPIADVMVRQMLFLDPPEHTRVRRLAAAAFTPRRVERLRQRIQEITDELIDQVAAGAEMDVIADLANPLPAIVTAELLGVPSADHRQLKRWSEDFAEMLGNFQHNPGRTTSVLTSVEGMTAYFRGAVEGQATASNEGLIRALSSAEVDGEKLTVDEIVANVIVTMVGGMETTTNLIGNGLLSLLRNPQEMVRLRSNSALMPSAIEELLRYESPSQHTARLALHDTELGGKRIRQHQAVIAVMGAANRDPERFSEPDRLDLARPDNRHVAFAWAGHFCFGAPLARMECEVALTTLLSRFPRLQLGSGPISWRPNLGLRGLTALTVELDP